MSTEIPGTVCAVGVLDRLLGSARSGRSQVMVVRGEPGVGKSALLAYTQRSASDCRGVQAVGIEYEMELAHAGLHQLCAPLLPLRKRLPGAAARRAQGRRLNRCDVTHSHDQME